MSARTLDGHRPHPSPPPSDALDVRLTAEPNDPMRIALIVPTLNEATHLAEALGEARAELGVDDVLIVTDGGSTDDTVEVALDRGAQVVEGPPGRGPQLDRGAREAIEHGAELLLFLHADSRLPDGWREAVERNAPSIGGGFLVRFDDPSALMRLGSRLVNWRTRRLQWPLGDQAQFVTADAYRSSGGFPHWPILEDTELLRRLRPLGPLHIVPLHVRTDARRFRRRGVIRTVVINWTIWLAHRCGVAPERLARWYRDVR